MGWQGEAAAATESHVLFLATMALAASIIMSCEILLPKAFHDRQPIGGLRAQKRDLDSKILRMQG